MAITSELASFDETIRAVDLSVPGNTVSDIFLSTLLRAHRDKDHALASSFASVVLEILNKNDLLEGLSAREEVRIFHALQAMASRLVLEFGDIKKAFDTAVDYADLLAKIGGNCSVVESLVTILLKLVDIERAAIMREKSIRAQSERRLKELRDQVSLLEGLVVQVPDLQKVIEQARANIRALEKESLVDEKTGLMTIKALLLRLEDLIDGKRAGLIMADFSGLKEINDQLGHYVGDLAIKHAAALLQRTTRNEDLVARGGNGSDEFTIAIKADEVFELRGALERLMEAFDQVSFDIPLLENDSTARVGFIHVGTAETYVSNWKNNTPGYNRGEIAINEMGEKVLKFYIAIAFGAEWITNLEEYDAKLSEAEALMYAAKRLSKGMPFGSTDDSLICEAPKNSYYMPGDEMPVVCPPSFFDEVEDL